MFRWLPLLLLTGCEALDQFGHRAYGEAMAWELACSLEDRDKAAQLVMDYAHAREEAQHEGRCGKGCQADLANWQIGVDRGVAHCTESIDD